VVAGREVVDRGRVEERLLVRRAVADETWGAVFCISVVLQRLIDVRWLTIGGFRICGYDTNPY
jgi:hypothetical protein